MTDDIPQSKDRYRVTVTLYPEMFTIMDHTYRARAEATAAMTKIVSDKVEMPQVLKDFGSKAAFVDLEIGCGDTMGWTRVARAAVTSTEVEG